MKINFDTAMLDMDGKTPLQEAENVILTLGEVCRRALCHPQERDTPEQKAKKFGALVKLQSGGEIEMESEEITVIKLVVGELYAALVYGQAANLLEGREAFAAPKG